MIAARLVYPFAGAVEDGRLTRRNHTIAASNRPPASTVDLARRPGPLSRGLGPGSPPTNATYRVQPDPDERHVAAAGSKKIEICTRAACAVLYNGKLIYAPYADAGPAGVIGELSYRAAELLGIPPSPINGGVASGVTYIVFTGANYVDPIESQSAADALGKQRAAALLADN
jgi:hypothetical protein